MLLRRIGANVRKASVAGDEAEVMLDGVECDGVILGRTHSNVSNVNRLMAEACE